MAEVSLKGSVRVSSKLKAVIRQQHLEQLNKLLKLSNDEIKKIKIDIYFGDKDEFISETLEYRPVKMLDEFVAMIKVLTLLNNPIIRQFYEQTKDVK